MPDAIVIAGVNGAGKTTFASRLLPAMHPSVVFLNADEIQNADGRLSSRMEASRELVQRLREFEAARRSFAVELTLSSSNSGARIAVWKSSGYRIILYYIQLASADLAVERVAKRVAAGGHDVPEQDIRRRLERSRHFFDRFAKELADEWYHYRNDDEGFELVDYQGQ